MLNIILKFVIKSQASQKQICPLTKFVFEAKILLNKLYKINARF